MAPAQGFCTCCSTVSHSNLRPSDVSSFLPFRPQLKYHIPATFSQVPLSQSPHPISLSCFMFLNYHFLKLPYLSIRLFTNCLSPNFNEGWGLLSPVPGMSPVHTAALRKQLMNEQSEGSWAQSHHSFSKKGTKDKVLRLSGSPLHGMGTVDCRIYYQAAAWACFKFVRR